MERSVVRAVHGEYGDFRDWDAIRAWASDIAAALKPVQLGAES
jgi:menaquinone-dependent protoporphyrinogen oxidase